MTISVVPPRISGSPLLILAGAGTGKTGTLVARAAWLREQGMQPSRILLLTFTRRAADDMLARAQPADSSAAERIFGGTFHAVAHRIIRAHAEAFALPPEFTVIDPGGRRRHHGHAARCARPRRHHDGQAHAARRDVRRDLLALCQHRHAASRRRRGRVSVVRAVRRQLAGLFTDFVGYKRRHGLVDFDDLLLLWRAALADAAAGPALRGLFDAVLVDEYQDVNAVQAEIVRLLRPGWRRADVRRR